MTTTPETAALPLDLIAEPPDPAVLADVDLADDIFRRWLPWRRLDGTLWLATCVPATAALSAEVAERTGAARIGFRQVSADDLAATAVRLLPEKLAFEAAERFALDRPESSAKRGLLPWQAVLPAIALIAVAAGLALDWRTTVVVLATVANVVFLANVGFKVATAWLRPLRVRRDRRIAEAERHRRESELSPDELRRLTLDSDLNAAVMAHLDQLPIYTILVPVYQEANVVSQILRNFERLDYPAAKLDILVLLEADDLETIAAARAADPPDHIRLMIVPPGEPRTKPRACNYGLLFARGKYVVIYDAEDRPDPDQLLKVLLSFYHDREVQAGRAERRPLACVQASLNYYNADYNVLTRMFGIEYAHWFDSMLPGMDTADTPLPLGGTSNHFLRAALEEVGGWDPYNVTEDADLGLRLDASGYRVDVVASTTWEEATAKVGPWIRQRTRWIKGYILTAAVNLRRPVDWLRRNDPRAWLTMFGLILGTPLAFMLYPLALGFTLTAWLLGPVVQIWLPGWLLFFGTFNMIAMNLLMIVSSGRAAWRRYNWRIGIFAVFLPVYWLLHSIAAWRAALQLAWAPHLWEKTPHGLTEEYSDSVLSGPEWARPAAPRELAPSPAANRS